MWKNAIFRLSGSHVSVLVAALLISAPAQALDNTALTQINRTAIEHHILPRYDRLSGTASHLAAATTRFCLNPSSQALPDLRREYNDAMDAWQGVQHITFGPIEKEFRGPRFDYWPDPRNIIGKQMAGLLSSQDNADLNKDRLAGNSAAVQGLPAFERLVFGADAQKLVSGAEAGFRCRYLTAIAANLSAIADLVLREWREGPGSYASVALDPARSEGRYHDPADVTLDIFKSLYTGIELIADHKLARPLGANAESARPRLAESWRSERSLKNIAINLEAAQDLYVSAFSRAVPDRDLDEVIRDTFNNAIEDAKSLHGPLEQTVTDASARKGVEALAAQVIALKTLLIRKVPGEIGIQVGFNSLDGD